MPATPVKPRGPPAATAPTVRSSGSLNSTRPVVETASVLTSLAVETASVTAPPAWMPSSSASIPISVALTAGDYAHVSQAGKIADRTDLQARPGHQVDVATVEEADARNEIRRRERADKSDREIVDVPEVDLPCGRVEPGERIHVV